MQNTEKSTIFAVDFVIYHDILDIKNDEKGKANHVDAGCFDDS